MAYLSFMMRPKKGIFRSGTSNVEVPERNKAAFPEAFRTKSHLEYYASLFNSVEINRTFYKLPLPSLVLHDMPMSGKGKLPMEADFIFKRYHEPMGAYQGRYSPTFLKKYATTITAELSHVKIVYAYFNITAEGDAPKDVRMI